MRCFLACFGLSKTRKHRKPLNKVPYTDQIHGRYEPLESVARLDLNSNGSESEFSGSKEKDISSISLKKKVSFNLNVKSYEPLPHVEYTSYFSNSEDDICEGNKEETVRTSYNSILDDFETESFPSDHRYRYWRESDHKMALEESDVDDYGSDGDDIETSEEYLDEIEASFDFDESGEGENGKAMPLVASLDQELKKLRFDYKVKRDRSEYVFSVLNPIENLTQWKKVKSKIPIPLKERRKENTRLGFDFKADTSDIKPLMQDTTVNTSLSNWLAPSK